MMIDQPPAIIRQITPELRREIGCAGLWVQWSEQIGGDDNKRREEVYRGYMTRCLNGEPVAIRNPASALRSR